MLKQLWNDDAGYIISTEMLLIFVILVLGLIAGLTNLRAAIVMELSESATAILSLNQSYNINGYTGCGGSTSASGYTDTNGSLSLTSGTSGAVMNNLAGTVNFNVCP